VAVDTGSLPLSLDPLSHLLDRKVAPPEFVIRPFFPRGELTEIVGAHGVFKSTIALAACLSVATGRPWGEVPSSLGRAAFITLEDGAFTLARRVGAWFEGVFDDREQAEADARSNLTFLARERSQGLVLTRTRDGVTEPRLDVAEHVARLVAGVDLVVLETASRIHDGPETNDAFMGLVRSLERVASTGAAVVIVRHVSKKAAREVTADSYAGRGGSALSDAVRSSLVVTREPGKALGPVTLTVCKATHAAPGATLTWHPIEVPDLGAVRLEPWSAEVAAVHDADLLLSFIATCEGGVVRSEIHKSPPEGLGRARALAALDLLRSRGALVVREERRGRNRQPAEVFYTRRPGRE